MNSMDSDLETEVEEEEHGGAPSPGSEKVAWTDSTSKILFDVVRCYYSCQPDKATIKWKTVVEPEVARRIAQLPDQSRPSPTFTGRQCRCATQSL